MSNTGKLSTRNVNRGLEWITFDDIMMTVNQSDSVPDRAGEFKHQITLTKLDGEDVVLSIRVEVSLTNEAR